MTAARFRAALARHRGAVAPAAILTVAMLGVSAVWALTAVWSLAEQTRLAELGRFEHPAILFWSTDVLAISCALVALAAAVDNRTAPVARLVVAVALSGGAYFNVEAVASRYPEGEAPLFGLVAAAFVPLASFVALEVGLGAIRRTVARWRGLPAPVPVPSLRMVRFLLAPWPAWCDWRRTVLKLTDPTTRTAAPVAAVPLPPVGTVERAAIDHPSGHLTPAARVPLTRVPYLPEEVPTLERRVPGATRTAPARTPSRPTTTAKAAPRPRSISKPVRDVMERDGVSEATAARRVKAEREAAAKGQQA